MFDLYDMREKLKKFDSISNFSFITPTELIIKDNELIGYIYNTVKGNTLKSVINSNIRVFDLLKNFDILIKDVKMVSENNFVMQDLHSKNIIYNDYYSIIDLDQGVFFKHQDNFKLNIMKIRDVIMDEIFQNKDEYILEFYNNKIDNLYAKTNWSNIDEIYNFFEYISKYIRINNPKIKDLRKKRLVRKEYNSYYKY